MKKNKIVLIGFMGSGKTVVGRFLSRHLEWDFTDTDEEIEKVTGLSIMQIFRKYGERRFRSEEELILKKLINKKDLVIATGGSIDLENHNLELLKEDGFFVLLEADLDVLYQRLSRKNNRPFIGKRPDLDKVEELLKARKDQYENLADIRVDTTKLSVEEAAVLIAEKYQELEHKIELE